MLHDNAYLNSGQIYTGDAGSVTIIGNNSKYFGAGALSELDTNISPVLHDHAYLNSGQIVTGDAGSVTINGNNSKYFGAGPLSVLLL